MTAGDDGRDVLRAQLEDHRSVAEATADLLPTLEDLTDRICEAYEQGGRVYTFGNGGSAADAQHLAAELVGRYLRERRPLPAVALTVDPSVVTCIANDYDFDTVFARQVEALAGPGDVVVGFTTSGASANVANGLGAARRAGALAVLFSGGDGGAARQHADVALLVPSTVTARIQEMHLLLLHLLSEGIDAWAAGERTTGARTGAS
jgi:D-sedoheptulose 7-phosphate isomerase